MPPTQPSSTEGGMVLYHVPGTRSGYGHWLLAESGAAYRLVELPRDGAERNDSAHQARHPLGRVPVLVDEDGNSVYESGAVGLRLVELYPDLAPAVGSHERALLYQWVFFTVTAFEHALERVFTETDADPPPGSVPFEQCLEIFERELEDGRDYLLGAFSAADVFVGLPMLAVSKAGLLDGRETLNAYCERLAARPAYRRAFEA